MRLKDDQETLGLDELMRRILTLRDSILDSADLAKELQAQRWMIEVISHIATASSLQALSSRLLRLLEEDECSSNEIQTTANILLDAWGKSCEERRTSHHYTIERTTWVSISAIVSTLLAILLGREGLVFIFQKIYDNGAELPGTTFVSFSAPDFTVYLIHVLVVGLLFIARFTQFGAQDIGELSDSQQLKHTCKQFLTGWTLIWAAWLALYLWLTIGLALAYFGFELRDSTFWAVADVLNVVSGIAFLYSYLVLDMPSVPTDTDPKRARRFQFAMLGTYSLAGVVIALSILGRFELFGLGEGGPIVQTFFVAVAMAFFFARLDSHYLNVRRWMLAPLYLYVAIQITWTDLAVSSIAFRGSILILALILKIYLFLVVTRWLQSGAIRRYLVIAAREYDRIMKEVMSVNEKRIA